MEYVEIGLWPFAFCWLSVLAVHAGTGAFNTGVALMYWQFDAQATFLPSALDMYGIGMPARHSRTIAVVHAACALPHGHAILSMLLGSLSSRRLQFRFSWQRASQKLSHPPFARLSRQMCLSMTFISKWIDHLRLRSLYDLIFGHTGLLGVGGRHYEGTLLVRELLETILQTAQAYRMSVLLPRATVNQLYALLIVLNCWLTVAVHIVFALRDAYRRLLTLLSDCALDLVSSLGVMLMIVNFYVPIRSLTLDGFANELWSGKYSETQVRSEMQLVFVVSWVDLGMRVVFAVGVMFSLGDIKALLQLQRRDHRIQQTPAQLAPRTGAQVVALVPCKPVVEPSAQRCKSALSHAMLKGTPRKSRRQRLLAAVCHVIFAAWGSIILAFHLKAASLPIVAQCQFQMRPWGAAQPSCYLFELDCHNLQINGSLQEIAGMWTQFDRGTVERITIRHCPVLEIPPLLQDFRGLVKIKMYNSTILSWASDAAITAANHPRIETIRLVRVYFADGDVPAGLLSHDSPTTLQEITICDTNLRRLPDDLDLRWPKGIIINLELGELELVSDSLIRLAPYSLSLYGNPIDTVPSSLFEAEGIVTIDFGETSITELPEQVQALSSTLRYIFLPNTNLSVFWSWLDQLIENANPDDLWAIYATGTPYCDELDAALDDSASNFDMSDQIISNRRLLTSANASYSLLMDKDANWLLISEFVSCDPYFAQPYFPLTTIDDDGAALVDDMEVS